MTVPHLSADELWPRRAALRRALQAFDEAGVAYCVLGGYERLSTPREMPSRDLDCMIDPHDVPLAAKVLYRRAGAIGADVVSWTGAPNHYISLAVRSSGPALYFTALDLHPDWECCGRRFLEATDVLRTRRRYEDVWIPAPDVEFCYCFIKRSVVGSLDEAHTDHLTQLFARDPHACRARLATLLSADDASFVARAASAGAWTRIVAELPRLLAALKRRYALRHPARFAVARLGRFRHRARRAFSTMPGLHVVLLGPDGVGKSSVIDAITDLFTPLFPGGVAMDVPRGVLRRPQAPTDRPHEKTSWGLPGSLAKSVYWFLYYSAGYHLRVSPALRQHRLHLSHRYLVDALVDAKRYRYSGPRWVLALLWRLAVKPDLIILLDASPNIIQGRKREVSPEETARQCAAYRSLVSRLPQGRIIDANRSLASVVADVRDAILGYMSSRTARRLEL